MIDPAEGTANGTSAIGSGWLGSRFRHFIPPQAAGWRRNEPCCKIRRRGEHGVLERSCLLSRVWHKTSEESEPDFPDEASCSSASAIRIDESPPSAANDAAKPTGKPWRGALAVAGPEKDDRLGHPVVERGRKGRLIRHAFLRD